MGSSLSWVIVSVGWQGPRTWREGERRRRNGSIHHKIRRYSVCDPALYYRTVAFVWCKSTLTIWTLCIHAFQNLQTIEETKRGVGKVEEKHLSMSEEGHMDDTLNFSRSQQEESRSARVIRKCAFLFHKFNRYAKKRISSAIRDSRICLFLVAWTLSKINHQNHEMDRFPIPYLIHHRLGSICGRWLIVSRISSAILRSPWKE